MACKYSQNIVNVSLYGFAAFISVVLLKTGATKQLHAIASPTSLAPPLGITVAPIRQYQHSMRKGYMGSMHLKASNILPEDRLPAQAAPSIINNSGAVLTASVICLAGLIGYVTGRISGPSALAMTSTTGIRPTMADTKLKFLSLADSSIPNMYNIPLQELLAQHHLIRYSTKYQYDEVFALGIVTVINQLLEGLPEADSERIQNAYFSSLGDSMEQFKSDAADLEQWASAQGKDLSLSGTDGVSEKLKAIAARAVSGNFQYSKFFSIGLFQLLQQSGQTDPDHFTALVNGMNLDKERVTKDLKVYKDLLKRLEMAKDMKEKFLERERKKQEERMAKKAPQATV